MTGHRPEEFTLGIESAILGGSLSLYRGKEEIDSWVGAGGVSRSEDLLPATDRMLSYNRILPEQIDIVAVSVGPGSFTGIRIGLSTVMGLADSLGAKYFGITALSAMAASIEEPGTIICAVPMGRNMICAQSFGQDMTGAGMAPRLFPEENFAQAIKEKVPDVLIFHGSMIGHLALRCDWPCRIVDAGKNIAGLVAEACIRGLGSTHLLPLFVDRDEIPRLNCK